MKRFFVVAAVVSCVAFSGGTVSAAEQCFAPIEGVAGCAYAAETSPATAGVVGTTPVATFDVHLGWVVGTIPIGDCSPTHVGNCVRVPVPGVYVINATVAPESFGTYGVRAVGSPAPCVGACAYEGTVYVGRRQVRQDVCYDASGGIVC